jgi:hypothetical protein
LKIRQSRNWGTENNGTVGLNENFVVIFTTFLHPRAVVEEAGGGAGF